MRQDHDQAERSGAPPASGALHVCAACRRPFVVPVAVLEVLPDGRFPVVLRCRNCDFHEVGAFSDGELEELDYALDAITGALEQTLAALALADELERIDRFAAALHDDLVLPEDF